MKKAIVSGKFITLVIIIAVNSIFACGCWNYVDLENYLLVTGFSIDKNKADNKYILTIEVLDFEASGKEAKQTTKFIETDGKTVFEAIRNAVNIVGKKLYWTHADVAILSEEIAKEGIILALDFIFRDPEVKYEMFVFISKEKTAKEILTNKSLISQSSSDSIHNMISEQDKIGKFPKIHVYDLINNLKSGNVYLPALEVKDIRGKKSTTVTNTAIFDYDKLVGYIDQYQSQALLFVTNGLKGGVITVNMDHSNKTNEISLEIFKSSTKLKPSFNNNKLTMGIDINLQVNIAENATPVSYISGENFLKLKKTSEQKINTLVEKTIRDVQQNYGTDTFGFGKTIKSDNPSLWRNIQKNWNETYKKSDLDIKVAVKIRNSGFVMKTITTGK